MLGRKVGNAIGRVGNSLEALLGIRPDSAKAVVSRPERHLTGNGSADPMATMVSMSHAEHAPVPPSSETAFFLQLLGRAACQLYRRRDTIIRRDTVRFMAPSILGPYRIVRQLGEGGMGVVYEAVNDAIERRVAIKVLHQEYAKNADVTARFFNEARAVNRIEHPGLVQISDYAQLPDGTAYIVMEFLKGESLAGRLKRGRLATGSALVVAWQVADALSAAHAKSIVHRDLKPDNVMLVSDTVAPGGERAKLLDFGIAKLVEAAKSGQVKTRTNMIMGTPRYMAPEQCRAAREADDKADVYALGIMLYEMLAGRVPFDAEGHGEIMAMHIYEAPPPVQNFVPDVPADVAALVHRLLTKDKEQRPAMRAVFGELGSLAAAHELPVADGTPARPSGSIPIFASLNASRRNSTPGHSTGQQSGAISIGPRWKASLVVGCALLLLGGGVTWFRRPSAHTPALDSTSENGSQQAVSKQLSPPERMVTWTIRSEPSGADVIRIRDGTVQGKTPWSSRQAFATGTEELRLRRSGYADRDITVERSGHVELMERLEVAPPSLPAVTEPATKPDSKRNRIDGIKKKRAAHFGHTHGPVQAEE